MLDSLASLGAGGAIIAILAALSVLSLTLITFKTLQLARVRAGQAARDQAVARWFGDDRAAAQAALAHGAAPADRVTAYAMQVADRGLSGANLRAAVEQRGNAEVAAMSRHLRLLELIAVIAPLLGLLGTVLGMIQSFQELELAQGAANAATLAGGIWQALLTTAAGLVVAIPAAAGAALLSARVDGAAQMIEAAAGGFLTRLDTGGVG